MKKLILSLIIMLSFFNCKVKEKPEFIKVENIKVVESNAEFVRLKANALFKNLNSVGGKLATEGIKVFVEGKELATVVSEEFKVPAKQEFTIPLDVKIETKRLLQKDNLNGLISSILGQKLTLRFKGDIKYKVLGFSHRYQLDQTEDIKIKL